MGTSCAPLLADIFLYSHDAVFALNRQETVGISVQFHISIHRLCFVNKQPRVWELPRPDVSRWTWDQRHDREQHFCYLPGFHSPCLLRWFCLQTSEGQRRSEFHLVMLENSETPSTSSVWPSDHRENYRSCARPFYSLVQIIPKALHSDYRGGWDYMTGLV